MSPRVKLKTALILELRNLVKQYPGHLALNRISLEVPRGAFFSLLGPSGCGKTTTLRLIAGFEEPTAGEIRLEEHPVNGRKPYQRNVSMVFQSYALFPHLTVEENIYFGLTQKKLLGVEKRASRAIALVQLSGKERRYPTELSGGERQRVALARSLATEPAVLLLDEPLAALDPLLRQQMRAELKELQRVVGITFLYVTHSQEEALALSDRIALMNNGALEQVGSPEEIYLRPRTRFAAGFLGPVNWIGGAGIRPERTRLSRTVPANGYRFRAATVVRSSFLGKCVHVRTRLASGEEAVAEVAADAGGFEPGDAVHVSWLETDELRFG